MPTADIRLESIDVPIITNISAPTAAPNLRQNHTTCPRLSGCRSGGLDFSPKGSFLNRCIHHSVPANDGCCADDYIPSAWYDDVSENILDMKNVY